MRLKLAKAARDPKSTAVLAHCALQRFPGNVDSGLALTWAEPPTLSKRYRTCAVFSATLPVVHACGCGWRHIGGS